MHCDIFLCLSEGINTLVENEKIILYNIDHIQIYRSLFRYQSPGSIVHLDSVLLNYSHNV